jgi:hypothetical protein
MAGRLKVNEVLQELSSREISEWMAFWENEPFGDEWRQAATVAAASSMAWAKPGAKISPEQFMPSHPPDDEPIEDDAAFLMAWQGVATMQTNAKPKAKK